VGGAAVHQQMGCRYAHPGRSLRRPTGLGHRRRHVRRDQRGRHQFPSGGRHRPAGPALEPLQDSPRGGEVSVDRTWRGRAHDPSRRHPAGCAHRSRRDGRAAPQAHRRHRGLRRLGRLPSGSPRDAGPAVGAGGLSRPRAAARSPRLPGSALALQQHRLPAGAAHRRTPDREFAGGRTRRSRLPAARTHRDGRLNLPRGPGAA
ncbi:MAG: hypothetical protein AVDCRST_MAG33-264, partial [uncultured Thermomicrobiales bacterium]